MTTCSDRVLNARTIMSSLTVVHFSAKRVQKNSVAPKGSVSQKSKLFHHMSCCWRLKQQAANCFFTFVLNPQAKNGIFLIGVVLPKCSSAVRSILVCKSERCITSRISSLQRANALVCGMHYRCHGLNSVCGINCKGQQWLCFGLRKMLLNSFAKQ